MKLVRELGHRERLAFALVVLFVVELLQFAAQVVGELSFVELANHDLLEALEDVGDAVRQRVDVVEVAERNFLAFGTHFIDGILQVSACTAPTYYEQIAFRVAVNLSLIHIWKTKVRQGAIFAA